MRTIPKVIQNVRETLLKEARKELFEEGYQTFNIRTVAGECGIAVGTLYNYFPSKEMILASVILEDWIKSQNKMRQKVEKETELFCGLEAIYNELLEFEALYHDIFVHSTADYSKYFSKERHKKLRRQLEEPIHEMLEKANHKVDTFTLAFLAESFLGASRERVEFEKLREILRKLLT